MPVLKASVFGTFFYHVFPKYPVRSPIRVLRKGGPVLWWEFEWPG